MCCGGLCQTRAVQVPHWLGIRDAVQKGRRVSVGHPNSTCCLNPKSQLFITWYTSPKGPVEGPTSEKAFNSPSVSVSLPRFSSQSGPWSLPGETQGSEVEFLQSGQWFNAPCRLKARPLVPLACCAQARMLLGTREGLGDAESPGLCPSRLAWDFREERRQALV